MPPFAVARLALTFALLASLLGCTASTTDMSSAGTAAHLSGDVHGGQQPVSNAAIQLYAIGAGGDGSAATPLLAIPALTDVHGSFNITSQYLCPSSTSQVYLVATGGNPGLSTGSNNTALAMMAALGPCGSLSASTHITINELTTVGSIAALYPYGTSPAAIGSASSDSTALAGAFAAVNEYTNIGTGTLPGPTLPANMYASSTEIDTLADILAACVNSSGGSYNDGTACGRLFYYATPAASPPPADTITAAIDILKNPTANVASIFNLVPSTGAPFQPTLSSAPSDWTLPILPIPAAPAFSLTAGSYVGTQTLTLSDSTAGATLYYTLDGTIPSTASSVYSGSLTIASSTTVKAIATAGGGRTASPVATAAYTINSMPASVTAVAGSGQSAKVGTAFTTPLQVQVLDSGGKPVIGFTVAFTLSAGAPAATFSPSTCTTGSSGLCAVIATAGSLGGTYTVSASAGALSTAFTLTNTGIHAYLVVNSIDFAENDGACIDGATGSTSANVQCTLRDALGAAASTASSTAPATITFAQTSATTLYLSHGTLNVPSYTTIQGATSGSGAGLTNLITVNGSGFTIFTEAAGVTGATINNLLLTGGGAFTGTGAANNGLGGAIFMAGGLAINNTTFSANTSQVSGGAISNQGGALTVNASTFVNNQAVTGYGGAIDNFYSTGTATVSNSTFTGNSAGSDGGAIYSSGIASITTSTIVANTSPYGGGIYNKGTTMTVTNSIVNGNTNQDCGGVYCAANWAYVVFSFAGTQVVDSNSITIAFTDSLGNSFSQTTAYGAFSTPAGLSSSFGGTFSENYSGLDTTSIGAQGINYLLVIAPSNGATLNPISITNPGKSFTATQVTYPFLLSNSNNVYGLSAAQINLGSLASNGGPTQTMLPLSGSAALCVISPSSATGTDQRGQPRSVPVGATTCQDAGAVQTSY